MSDQRVSFDVNGNIFQADYIAVSQKSDLVREIVESCSTDNQQSITLQLERPEKFGVLLSYLESGSMGEELSSLETFASYINDTIYLKIPDLEEHFYSQLSEAVNLSQCDRINFEISQPNFDFMQSFLDQFMAQFNMTSQNFLQLLILMGRWGLKKQIAKAEVTEMLVNSIDYHILERAHLEHLRKKYSDEFEYVIPSQIFLYDLMVSKVKCKFCNKYVSRMSIDSEDCFQSCPRGQATHCTVGKHRS